MWASTLCFSIHLLWTSGFVSALWLWIINDAVRTSIYECLEDGQLQFLCSSYLPLGPGGSWGYRQVCPIYHCVPSTHDKVWNIPAIPHTLDEKTKDKGHPDPLVLILSAKRPPLPPSWSLSSILWLPSGVQRWHPLVFSFLPHPHHPIPLQIL